MIDVEEYQKLERRVSITKSQIAEMKGAMKELQKQLKKEFGVSTLEEAEQLLAELEDDCVKAEKEYDRALARFKRNHEKDLVRLANLD